MFLPLVYLRNANSKKPLNASLKDLGKDTRLVKADRGVAAPDSNK